MAQNLLILGGTTEASQLARAVADRGLSATLSYAGRVANPRAQPLPTRVGGFGGVDGLAVYLRNHNITHLIDATHPFAAQMSSNAAAAAAQVGIPLAALTRPPWQAGEGDQWTHVPDIPTAAQALSDAPRRVMLALGRLHLAEFATQPQHHYLLRLVDEPENLPLPNTTVIVARGPFDVVGDTALMRHHQIDVVVSKNAGGAGAEAKVHAARALNIPMIMIDRPALPDRVEIDTVAGIFGWLDHAETDRGV